MVKLLKNLLGLIKEDFLLVFLLVLLCVDRFGSLPIYLCLLLPLLCFHGRKRHVGTRGNAIVIAIFSIIYSVIALFNGYFEKSSGSVFFFLLYPLFFYWVGEYVGSKKTSYIIYFLVVISISFAIYPILMTLLAINQSQFVDVTRELTDTKGERLGNATIIGTKVSLVLSFIGVLFTNEHNKGFLIITITLILFSLLGLVVNVHLVNRTGLFVFAAALLSSLFINRSSLKRSYIYLLIIGFGLLVYVNRNYLEFALSESTIAYQERADRGSTIENGGGRIAIWSKAVSDIFENPIGINQSLAHGHGYNYAHNIFMDLPLRGSLLSLAFFLVIVIIQLKNLMLLYRYSPHNMLLTMIFVMNIAFFLQLISEPVMDGIMAYYFAFFMMIGICSELVKEQSFMLKCQPPGYH